MEYNFSIENLGIFFVKQLTQKLCIKYKQEILDIINIIPYIHWTAEDLFSNREDLYKRKWNYSYIVFDREDNIIGVLIAYFRISDEKHIFDSLYIHRLAIVSEYQHRGIGTKLLNYFINKSFMEIPWLLNISVQTNNNLGNSNVISFYHKIGFRDMYNIYYQNKTDILMLVERGKYNYLDKSIKSRVINLKHPKLSLVIDGDSAKYDVLPVVYFASTNEKKKEIVRFIFHNYNIEVCFVEPPIEMIEPQVEGPNLEEERKLVSIPLKNVSRFINDTPYVIEDTMLFIEYFNRNNEAWELPGLDTKRWLRQIGLEGMLEILGGTDKRHAKFVSQTGAYIKSSSYCFGRGEITGKIADRVSEICNPKYGTYPYFFHLIFIPDGADKTLAEMDMHEYAKYDYMRKGIVQLISEISHCGSLQRQYTLFDYIKECNK